jgi:hypothetical protein
MVTLFPPAVKKDNSRSFLTALNQDKTISTVYLVVKKCQKLGISRDVGLKLFAGQQAAPIHGTRAAGHRGVSSLPLLNTVQFPRTDM